MTAASAPRAPRNLRARHRKERLAMAMLWAVGALLLLVLGWFLYDILSRGLPVLDWSFLTGRPKSMNAGGGVGPELFNTFYVTFLSLLFSLPVGLGAGIYLAEYARPGRLTDLLRLSVETLASVPSIVFGLFGLIVFVNAIGASFNILSGALTLSLLNLPVLVRVTEEAMRAVPVSYREGSLALGATRWQTTLYVVLPAAMQSIITGVSLVAGRAVGETALLIYTAGLTVSRYAPDFSLLAGGETLAVRIWYVKSVALLPDADRIASGASALLLVVVLVFNGIAALPLVLQQWRSRRLAR